MVHLQTDRRIQQQRRKQDCDVRLCPTDGHEKMNGRPSATAPDENVIPEECDYHGSVPQFGLVLGSLRETMCVNHDAFVFWLLHFDTSSRRNRLTRRRKDRPPKEQSDWFVPLLRRLFVAQVTKILF